MSIRRCVSGAAVALVVLLGLAVAPGQADMRPDPKPMEPTGAVLADSDPRQGDPDASDQNETSTSSPDDTMEWEYYDKNWKPTGEKGSRVLTDSGSGGTVKNSGCIKVTVYNRYKSALGKVLWSYNTWTRWCWDRYHRKINYPTVGWGISNVDTCWSWEGQVGSAQTGYYDWAGGVWPESGYRHYRKGHFLGTCVVTNNRYPANTLRSHSNGTWTWTTSD